MNIKHLLLLSCTAAFLVCGGCSQSEANETVKESALASPSPAETSEETETLSLTLVSDPPPAGSVSGSQAQEEESKPEETDAQKEEPDPRIEQFLRSMTLEEKVAQLFIILPESLVDGVNCVTAAGETTQKAFDQIPVGGLIYLGNNLQSRDQVKAMLSGVQSFSRERLNLPAFLCIDEEGGTVARIGGSGKFDVPVIGNMADIGRSGDPDAARQAGIQIGTYLSDLGFNLDFAPVADVLTNPDNQVVKKRSFGEDPEKVSAMAQALADGLREQGILSVYKHFPGHGATAGDTHQGYAYTEKTLDELRACELIPFQNGIQAGIPFIMVGHFSLPQIEEESVPASLSPTVITKLLREEMGYEGIVITDALSMEAIIQQYSPAESALMALKAGNDILLMPGDFKAAYQGVLDAVAQGELSEERIDESLRRILRVKLAL